MKNIIYGNGFSLQILLIPALASLLLIAGMLWFCYRFGRLTILPAGAALAILLLSSEVSHALLGGLPRSFGPPLVLAFLYYFVTNRERGILAVLLLQAAFYPPVLLFCGACYSIYLGVRLCQPGARRVIPPATRLILAAVVCALLLLPVLGLLPPGPTAFVALVAMSA